MRYICDTKRHLVCVPYSINNLHRMADDLGIKRCWFHKNHYDLPKRRIAEITAKCEIVSSKDIVRIIRSGTSHKELTEQEYIYYADNKWIDVCDCCGDDVAIHNNRDGSNYLTFDGRFYCQKCLK